MTRKNKNIEEALKDYKIHLDEPVSVYINWAAYDELSDNIRLNDKIALRQFHELLRLREQGVQFDYYLMDAFWFSKTGGYREWRKESWPNGPDEWFALCEKHGIKPGLWISTNLRVAGYEYWFLDPIPEWEDSLSVDKRSFCLFEGGYLPHLMETLRMHARHGVKMFKFDFADFTAVTPEGAKKYAPHEAFLLNKKAFLNAISKFRQEFPDVLFLAYNGYGGYYLDTSAPFTESVDPEWLMAFDSLYCGDPRLADIPCMNFWRSKDIYSDHMVKEYFQSNIPLKRIDNTAFMIGNTGTCYYRRKEAWKGMLLLSLARGGWVNTYYGNLDLLTDEDGAWFAKAQKLYLNFQKEGEIKLIGGIPGQGEVYGYKAKDADGEVNILVNPDQMHKTVALNDYLIEDDPTVLFCDAGDMPEVNNNKLIIGPEQLILLGSGKYRSHNYHLGTGEGVKIPQNSRKIEVEFEKARNNGNTLTAKLNQLSQGTYRVIFQQFHSYGTPARSSGGAYPDGTTMEKMLVIQCFANQQDVELKINYNKALWSGLSWAVAEFELTEVTKEFTINCSSKEEVSLILNASVYQVNYE